MAIRPDFAEAFSNLGALQLEQGALGDAVDSCRCALRIRPELADAHQNLGKALLALAQPDEAAASCRRALELRPAFAEACNSLGNALLRLTRFDEAIAGFRRAIALHPEFAEAHANLGNALRGVGRLEEAVACYRQSVTLDPGLVDAQLQLATALRLQRRAVDAEATCRQVLDARPESAAALAVLAELRADAGCFAEAEALFRQAAAIEPQSTEAWAGIARSRRMTTADAAWLAQAKCLADGELPAQRELPLRFAMGKYCDDLGEFDDAFANYRRGNELSRLHGPAHDQRQLTRTIDRIIRSHDRAWFDQVRPGASPSERPVLIVGMLRSGTTLAEQILSSHPEVFGAAEQEFWAVEMAGALSRSFATGSPRLEVDDAARAGMAARYLELLYRLSADASRVVDKLPTNFLCLGLIHAALPRARIIHMRRHPIDTCLSIYFQQLEAVNSYTSDLADLAQYYREYRRLMSHWQAVLPPGTMLEVPYEALVEDPAAWTRRMLDFLALPWRPACLDFHRSERAVVTASKWQVRQQITRSSVGRWRRYERHLGPLRSLFDLD